MPTLKNPKYERFAQERAAGKNADASYMAAGYKGSQQQIGMVGDIRKPVTLHGTAESFCLNFGGAALPAGFTANYVVETIEY